MDGKVLGGLILVLILAGAITGYIFYNSNSNTLGVNNNLINNQNISNNNISNQSSNLLSLILPAVNLIDSTSGSSHDFSPSPNHKTDPMDNILSKFDAYVKSTFPKTGVPGSAVVIIQNGKIIYMNCLGVGDVSSGALVTPDTLFQIGSCTKAFTSALIAKLVDEGKMNWNDTVRSYFTPNEFKLYNNKVSDEITIADLLCHRSGLPLYSGDDLWMYFNNSYPNILHKMRYVENDTAFRSTWNYNNVLYALAGECAARATGKSYDELMKKLIFDPLQMKSSTASFNSFLNSQNRVQTYIHLNGKLTRFGPTNLAQVESAGSISSSIKNMANWLIFQLANGKFHGTQVVSSKELTKTKTAQIPTGGKWYGFGWGINYNDTIKVISHLGDAAPSRTAVTFYPKYNLGIIAVSNEGSYGQYLNRAITNVLFQLYFKGKYEDPWPAFKQKGDAELKDREGKLPAPPLHPVPPKKLSTYTGVYSNIFLGKIQVTSRNGKLVLYLGNNVEPVNLKHWSGNIFKIVSGNDPESYDTPVYFTSIHNGKAQQVTLKKYEHSYGMNGTLIRTK